MTLMGGSLPSPGSSGLMTRFHVPSWRDGLAGFGVVGGRR